MAQKWNVKVRDLSNNSVEHVADFISSESAYDYKAKLINGSGGLFGRRYEAWEIHDLTFLILLFRILDSLSRNGIPFKKSLKYLDIFLFKA